VIAILPSHKPKFGPGRTTEAASRRLVPGCRPVMSVVMESASGADYDFGHESAQHIDNEWRFDIQKFTLGLYA
jgi:hypothetical protein